MERLLIRHLTIAGPDKESASINFSDNVTVIYGASDTGKSYIVDAIDFMLGATKLRNIPESHGYTRSFIGLATSDGNEFTLSRAMTGGDFQLFLDSSRTLTTEPGDETLSRKHSSANRKNLSNYLLSLVGLDGRLIRRNSRNETKAFSYRDVAHFTLVDETRMQAQRSPVFPSGQYTTRTADRSAFRLLLTGEDDSELTPDSDPQRQRISTAKLEVIDRLIREAEEDLADEGVDEIRGRLARLNASIDSTSESIDALVAERESVVSRIQEAQARAVERQQRLEELSELLGRFGLLESQYESDLSRLEMIREAGTLLGYFQSGTCVFCGAAPEHQTLRDHMVAETTQIADAVATEVAKTTTLRNDLQVTLDDLRVEQNEVEISRRSHGATQIELRSRLEQIDGTLRPRRAELRDLIEKRSELERQLSVHNQIRRYIEIRHDITEVAVEQRIVGSDATDLRELREFSEIVRNTLVDWGVPGSEHVTFSASENDLLVGDQVRANRGKGMRAILHAAFTVSLATYCLQRDLPHPGFVVLDSPVVTYRDPDTPVSTDDEFMPRGVADRFFAYLCDSFEGQAVVIENVNPPANLNAKAFEERFSGTASGRWGFFPRN